ncbi:hypothetical protein GCM10011339_37330 [Echinicola rosea]|uniref:Peptide-N(4)-(N-acetyl-beta-glucosaminyl)asparagine amidase n=1 Tax=Echinicola rosea TaxID=1807691 RepID=A0ABQ1V9N3_9BACT|nr:hypothetical protein GCM10011339_37330 [Echinicola rosea]
MEKSGNNKEELEKILHYYKDAEDKEKLKAAKFLIGNMEGKYWFGGEEKEKYKPLFDTIQHLWEAGKHVNFDYKKSLGKYWDSLKQAMGNPRIEYTQVFFDLHNLDADFVIDHIDQAFIARETLPWCQNLSFEDFCDYVLPYRIGTEVPENWRISLWDKWQTLRDTITEPNRMKLAKIINDHNAYKMHHMGLFWSYPFDMTASEFERVRLGSCKHSVFYTAMAMRANGLPVGVDFVPQWAGSNAGHEWNVLLLEDDTFYPFDAVNKGFALDLSFRKVAKVFRKTFIYQTPGLSWQKWQKLPPEFQDFYRIDVTHDYVRTFDVDIPLITSVDIDQPVFLATYNNQDWVPQYWGEVKGKKVFFRNMGGGIVYILQRYNNGLYEQISEPFLLDTLGNIVDLEANTQDLKDMKITRKYPLTSYMKGIMGFVIGNRIQGANKRNFSDSTTFFSINKTPEKIETKYVDDKSHYRYVRMWIPEGGRGDMSELEFYGMDEQTGDTVKLEGKVIGDPNGDISGNRFFSYPFDGDLLTYFMRPRKMEPWVGLDLGSPQRIVKVRYCPRSDTNFIEVGDTYELFYWKEKWVSMGQITASQQELYYEQVPSQGLYILRNLTKGKEERIFTYAMGEQLWW